MGPASKGDAVALLENGTVKSDKVALKDLAFWLPYTKEYLGEVVPFAPSFDALIRLPVAQIGFILSGHQNYTEESKYYGGASFNLYAESKS